VLAVVDIDLNIDVYKVLSNILEELSLFYTLNMEEES
jgi:hypothetical protein